MLHAKAHTHKQHKKLLALLKSRIRISGIATLRKHKLLTQPRKREEERAWFIKTDTTNN
jgi:hypothetical protein